MTVIELIEFLKTQPQDIDVVLTRHSEQMILESKYIDVQRLCERRNDDWIQDYREDLPSQDYLVFHGF